MLTRMKELPFDKTGQSLEAWQNPDSHEFARHFNALLEWLVAEIDRDSNFAALRNEIPREAVASEVWRRSSQDKRIRAQQFESPRVGAFRGYLQRLIKSTLVDMHRERGALKRGAGHQPAQSLSDVDTHQPGPSAIKQPLKPIDDAIGRDLIEVMLSRLDERERQVFSLRLLEGREFLEIAQRMGTTESAVRSLFHRMREKLPRDD